VAKRRGGRDGDAALGQLIQQSPSLSRHWAHPASPAEATYYATIDNLDMAA
jgi:hypothetical protein